MKRFVFAAALIIATVLTACRSSPPTRFFSLTPTDGQKITASGIGGPVHVAAVHISESLDEQELIRESETGRVVVSNRNRWAAPLDEMLREVLTRDLARRLPPRSVVLPDEPSPAGTRRIVLDVLYFAGDTTGKIVLSGGWSVLPPGSDIPLLTREVHLRDTTDPSDYANQVTAMSRLLGLLADEIVRELSTPRDGWLNPTIPGNPRHEADERLGSQQTITRPTASTICRYASAAISLNASTGSAANQSLLQRHSDPRG